ncbi:unnamed protein product [Blepharisma stoltei]|uniref:2Fe-2S ferredoxin-type domain-containing protein n=1 Tax=Blepharisma stoltei TaxID=1481888 RepID=A0AAU9J2Q3_9CILI|nr:unnamed protein product [Blepharisma stoltei]
MIRIFRRAFSQVRLNWITPDGKEIATVAKIGETLLENAHANGIDLEGACEGSCACSTCHIILEPHIYDCIKEATADEEDMLDLAFGLTPTSRLGCQIKISQEMDNCKIKLPSGSVNLYVDGHKPKPH